MLRTKPDTARDTFIVFDIEDRFNASVCLGEAEAREIIDQFGAGPSIRVHRITLDELATDVTETFLLPEEDGVEPFDGDYCHVDNFRQLLREAR